MGLKGQSFSIGAVIFGALLLLVAFSFQTPDYDRDDGLREYFENVLTSQQQVYNQQLKENYSPEHLKHSVYLHNRFINTTASRKGLDYRGLQALMMPEREQALIVNYGQEDLNFTFYNDSTYSSSVEALQTVELEIGSSHTKYNLTVADLDINETIGVDGPTILVYTELSNDQEQWKNYVVR